MLCLDNNTCLDSFSADICLSPSSQPQSRVVFTERAVIDESNEEVQELLEAEMGTVEQCIRAIELYGTAHKAMHYMMEMEERENVLQTSDVQMLPFSPVHDVSPELPQRLHGFVVCCCLVLCHCNSITVCMYILLLLLNYCIFWLTC